MTRFSLFTLTLILFAFQYLSQSAEPTATTAKQANFKHHYIERELPTPRGIGDYGQTALVNLDGDGDLDFVLGRKGAGQSGVVYWFEFQKPDRWIKHIVGYESKSDVGLAALDVDGDGWIDLVCSGVWYRNTGKPREETFQRIVFDEKAASAHDVIVGDIDRDGFPDIVMMGDEKTELNSLRWYKIPGKEQMRVVLRDKNSAQHWESHLIGPPVHGAIAPNGLMDIDGDGDLDVIRADTWFENQDGKGLVWVAHRNIPFGRKGPYGFCVRTAVADIDRDGVAEIVMLDADIVDSKGIILRNADGKGGRWTVEPLPQSFTYGSLHALAVADFNGDGLPDIVSNEQEELLPSGRQNPRWILWENLGKGQFREHVLLDEKLGGHELVVGDVDGDGDVDICSKPWGALSWNGNGGKIHVDFLENLRLKK